MNNLNSVLLEGNLTDAPEFKQVSSGKNLILFTVASNRFDKEVDFFEVQAWGNLAQDLSQKLKKGSGVRAIGRLKQNRWIDAEGNKRQKVVIVAEHVEIKFSHGA